MALLLWRNMNIMAFRGSLGNYMAVMLLSFNGIFRFSIYPASLGGKSIKLFTFATICPGLSCISTCGKAQRWNARHVSRCHWVKVAAQWDRLGVNLERMDFVRRGRCKEQVHRDTIGRKKKCMMGHAAQFQKFMKTQPNIIAHCAKYVNPKKVRSSWF